MSSAGLPVVVGIDGGGSAADAVDWAAAEAATRGSPLRIVHAARPPVPGDPYGVVSPIDGLGSARTAGEDVLRESVARARSVASDLDVSARLLWGSTAPALLREADGAGLLVLGSRGLHGLRALLARSVSVRIATHASCPVVVVPPRQAEDAAAWSPPRVVVGIDGAGSCIPAVGFAFRAARQRGITLAGVSAWTPDPPADLEAMHGPPSMAEVCGRRSLDRALQRWHCQFPDVPVVTKLVRGDPARAVIAESRGAALVVVGCRGRGHLAGTVLGSVSRAVLQHGRSPVAVVRDGRASGPATRRDRPASDRRA